MTMLVESLGVQVRVTGSFSFTTSSLPITPSKIDEFTANREETLMCSHTTTFLPCFQLMLMTALYASLCMHMHIYVQKAFRN